jgi:hypothetical protein
MPFDWNLSRIKKQNIFVHEELRLPKSWKSFVGSGFAGSFNATVNGVPVTGRSLAIDPFSYPNAIVLHYLINKNDLINIAEIRQKQLEHPEQQQKQQQGNVSSNTATNSSSSSSLSDSNSTNNNTKTTRTTTAAAPTLTTNTSRISPSATVNKTAYNIGDDGRFFMDKGSTNLYNQNLIRPRLILLAANTSIITGITNANTSRNLNTNNNASVINPGIPNKPKVSDEGVMRFALMSSTESNKRNPAAAAASAQTSSDLVTDTGAIHVIVSWLPNPLAPAKESNVKVQFSDAMTSGPLNANVKYDLMILDKNGTTAVKKENLVAKNGLGTQTVTFPAKDVYQLEIKIKGLQRTGQSVPDLSRNGIARGYVVVPEFPSGIAETLTMVGALSASMIMIRKINTNRRKKK